MELTAPKRVIIYNGQTLADLDPSASIDAVIKMHAAATPELATAQIAGPEYRENEAIFTIKSQIGTKG
jgi:PRTRC genetic system protein C